MVRSRRRAARERRPASSASIVAVPLPSPASGGAIDDRVAGFPAWAGSGRGPAPTVVIGGGVARNRRLREAARARLGNKVHLVIPAPELCTDNAAMIGAAALIAGERRGP